MNNTPEVVTELRPGEVFVFGSNSAGRHSAGAAKVALDRFGARWGVGEGLEGRSYALPTMGTPTEFESAVRRFLLFASDHPELRFLVTRVGTGIAGYTVEEIAPWFAEVPANVALPVEFEQACGNKRPDE